MVAWSLPENPSTIALEISNEEESSNAMQATTGMERMVIVDDAVIFAITTPGGNCSRLFCLGLGGSLIHFLKR